MSPDPVSELVSQAEQCFAQSKWVDGLQHAEQAWQLVQAADESLRCRVGLLVCQGRYRTGALSQMLELALPLTAALRTHSSPEALNDFLRMTALVAADAYRFEVSLAYAQEALAVAQSSGDLARLSMSTNVLGCSFERSGDPWQGERLMRDAVAQARQQPQVHPLFVALNNLCGVLIGKHYLLRDVVPPPQALDPLQTARPFSEEAIALAGQLPDPFFAVFARGNMGELLVHLGEHDKAQLLLEEALALAQSLGVLGQVVRLNCSLGELALARGDVALAANTLLAVLKMQGTEQHPTVTLRCHHALWRAFAQTGEDKAALSHLSAYMQLERSRATRQLRAQSELFVTRVEAEQARQEARRHRQRAQDLEVDVRLDALTGLGNRREFDRSWPRMLRDAEQDQTPLAVAMLDLDHFKQVNDRFGHAVGDRVLARLGALLRTHTRQGDLLVRMGGEEFLLAMPQADASHALEICERLRQQVAQQRWAEVAPGLQVTLSLGLATMPGHHSGQLLQAADAALYQAKASGRNSLAVAPPPAA
jgi:diguanylate cyclase (GGDEF)-like protein